jgi:hypothetical protein
MANNNKVGLITWGTKDGTQTFFYRDVVQKQVDIRHSLKDMRSIVEMNELNKNFYSIEIEKEMVIYNIYKSIQDWRNRNKGFLAISLFVPHDIKFSENIIFLLNSLMKIYEDKYLDSNLRIKTEPENQKLFYDTIDSFAVIPIKRRNQFGISTSKSAYIEYDNEKQVEAFLDNVFLEKFYKYKEIFFLPNSKDARGILNIDPTTSLENLTGKIIPEKSTEWATFRLVAAKAGDIKFPFKITINGAAKIITENPFYHPIGANDKQIKVEVSKASGFKPVTASYEVEDLINKEEQEIKLENTFNFIVEVCDNEDSEIIKAVYLKIEGKTDNHSREVNTNNEGVFKVTGLNINNHYTITASKEGFETKSKDVSFESNGEEKVFISLGKKKEIVATVPPATPHKKENKQPNDDQGRVRRFTCKVTVHELSNPTKVINSAKVEIDDTKKTFAFTNKYGIASLSNINGDDSNKTYQVIVSKEGYITIASAISYNNKEITVELKKAGGNAKPFWKKRQVRRIFWVSFILIAITVSAYLGNAYYQGNKDLAAYKEKTERTYDTKIKEYIDNVAKIVADIAVQKSLMADEIKTNEGLSKQFQEAEGNPDINSLLNNTESPILDAIKHLGSLEDTVTLQTNIQEYYVTLENTYQAYKKLYDALPKVEAKKVDEEEDKPNVESTEPKVKTAKEKLDEANAEIKKNLTEYSKGLCGNKSKTAGEYKLDVDLNNMGFKNDDRKTLMAKFELIEKLLREEYNLRVNDDIDALGELKKIKDKQYNLLSNRQKAFLDDAIRKNSTPIPSDQ